jgi:beta-glucosidase
VLKAGMDINCDWTVDDNIYRALVNDSTISEADVDSALGHLLSVRFRLGEFDDPAKTPYRHLSS